jgi:S-disulfanyl-L-cysteine oxidoreductase SoxD
MCTRRTLVTVNGPRRHSVTEVRKIGSPWLRVSVACGSAFVLALLSNAAFAQNASPGPVQNKPNLGQRISEAEIAAWDISILPDGTGLPPGSGTPDQGAKVYAAKCALCHGPEAKGGTNAALVGGGPLTNGIDTPKTIANFWPYATTLFDFTRRAMPWQQPRTLTNDEVYALTAYILSLNKIISPTDVMNAQTLPKVRMPNRDGFVVRFPDKMP